MTPKQREFKMKAVLQRLKRRKASIKVFEDNLHNIKIKETPAWDLSVDSPAGKEATVRGHFISNEELEARRDACGFYKVHPKK